MRLHLVDTPMVFALRLGAAIFARNMILYDGISGEKRKFPAQKSLPSAFSCEELSQICKLRQPLFCWKQQDLSLRTLSPQSDGEAHCFGGEARAV